MTVAYNDALRLLLKKPRWTRASGLVGSNHVNTLYAVLKNLMFSYYVSPESVRKYGNFIAD